MIIKNSTIPSFLIVVSSYETLSDVGSTAPNLIKPFWFDILHLPNRGMIGRNVR